MATISVLVVVDVENALASNNLGANVYMIDSNKYFGSGTEGTAELYTACHENDQINWSVVPVDPSTNVAIAEFTGQMITSKICLPKPYQQPNGTYWAGAVESQGATGNIQYSIVMTMDGRQLGFDPFLKIS
jgi:hypothetical protein